jgi:hypothetical protein
VGRAALDLAVRRSLPDHLTAPSPRGPLGSRRKPVLQRNARPTAAALALPAYVPRPRTRLTPWVRT